MVSLVLVSHSTALAEGVAELAREMGGEEVAIAAAGGLDDGAIGTDAARVMAAVEEVRSPDGVLVLMDLGSAVMSAELAIELADLDGAEVRLSPAPLVEGLVAAVVGAAGGADLATVAREAESALKPKQTALSETAAAEPSEEDGSAKPPDASVTITLINPTGLHARPAAQLATALGQLDAEVAIAANGREADGASLLELLTLGTEKGTEITVSATGPDAQRAVDTARTLVEEGFGELDAETT